MISDITSRIALALVLSFPAFSQDFALVYPHSMIPGGIATPEQYEAQRVYRSDVGFLRPQYLQRDLVAYVDYRDGDSVRWTTSQITLHKGELVFTDRYGHMLRGRCGNDISIAPPPKAFVTPPQVDLETPAIAWATAPDLAREPAEEMHFVLPELTILAPEPPIPAPIPVTLLPPDSLPFRSALRLIFSGAAPLPGIRLPPERVTGDHVTPEPATLWLLLSGALTMAVMLARKRIRRSVGPAHEN